MNWTATLKISALKLPEIPTALNQTWHDFQSLPQYPLFLNSLISGVINRLASLFTWPRTSPTNRPLRPFPPLAPLPPVAPPPPPPPSRTFPPYVPPTRPISNASNPAIPVPVYLWRVPLAATEVFDSSGLLAHPYAFGLVIANITMVLSAAILLSAARSVTLADWINEYHNAGRSTISAHFFNELKDKVNLEGQYAVHLAVPGHRRELLVYRSNSFLFDREDTNSELHWYMVRTLIEVESVIGGLYSRAREQGGTIEVCVRVCRPWFEIEWNDYEESIRDVKTGM